MTDLSLQKYSNKVLLNLQNSEFDLDVKLIFNRLNLLNRLCWISGGAVRDFLLDIAPKDIDLTTDATETEILENFPNAILVGQVFGVYKIPLNGQIYDLTVFREEDKYIDGRRPLSIKRSDPKLDAFRRDFTMNALFFDLKSHQIVDYVDGVSDILNKKIKCVGDPNLRFQEDHLRILRLIRFKYQMGFSIQPAEYEVALKLSDKTKSLSGERLFSELEKLKTFAIRLELYKDDLFFQIMKHNSFVFDPLVFQSTSSPEDQFSLSFEFFVMLGCSEQEQKKMKSRFKYSNHIENYLLKCGEIHILSASHANVSEFILKFDQSEDYLNIVNRFLDFKIISEEFYLEIMNCYTLFSKPLITSKDLIFLTDKRKYSTALIDVRRWQIQQKVVNKSDCLSYLKEKYN